MRLSHRPLSGLLVLLLAASGAARAFGQDSGDHAVNHMTDQMADQMGRHGVGHAEMHDLYKTWHPPDNSKTSCCNNADCRPTRAYVDENGIWRAWNGLRWLVVPPDRTLPTDFAGDGRSHLCENKGYIYCFAPASPRS